MVTALEQVLTLLNLITTDETIPDAIYHRKRLRDLKFLGQKFWVRRNSEVGFDSVGFVDPLIACDSRGPIYGFRGAFICALPQLKPVRKYQLESTDRGHEFWK